MKQWKLKGKVFGKIICLKNKPVRDKRKNYIILGQCICGVKRMFDYYSLSRNLTTSCGCFQKEATSERFTKHGMSRDKFYRIWQGMRYRISNPNLDAYQNYGGRGIKVSVKWQNFYKFKKDMYESYLEHLKEFGKKNTTIERKNVNGDYCKKNCRWATMQEQGNNKRKSVIIKYKNKEQTLIQWAKELGLNYDTVQSRRKRKINNPELLFSKNYLSSMQKLTREKVLEIREKYKRGLGKILAEEYGVSGGVISEIVNFSRNYAKII